MEISHLSAKKQLQPVSRYVFGFELSRGRLPDRVLIADSDLTAIAKVVKQHSPKGVPETDDLIERACRYRHHFTFRGVPIVSIREGMRRA